MKAALMGMLMIALSASRAASQAQQPNEWDAVQEQIQNKRARWTAGRTSMHQFSRQQRRARLGALRGGPTAPLAPPEKPLPASGTQSKAALDWRNNGGVNVVTPIKDQGQCGSCWAFATTAGLESQILMAGGGGDVPDAAEQVLVSCSRAGSCNGGYPLAASQYMEVIGLPPEADFPYTGGDTSCRAAVAGWQQQTARLGSVWTIPANVSAIKAALAAYGPLPATFEVYSDFYSYSSGVYSYTGGDDEGGHDVLIIGYDDAAQAFTVKNSWGTDWGEAGFFQIAYSEINGRTRFGAQTLAYSMPCYYLLTPPTAAFPKEGGSGTFTVKASGGPTCPAWTASSNLSWIHVTGSTLDSKNNGTVTFSVAPDSTGSTVDRGGFIKVSAASADPGRSGVSKVQKMMNDPNSPIVGGTSRFMISQE